MEISDLPIKDLQKLHWRPLKTLKIYLAGPCKNVEDEGRGWREKVAEKLASIADWSEDPPIHIEVFDPTKYFSYSEKKHKTDHQVMSYYYHNIKDSDLVLVNLNDTESSCGTCMELQYAADHDIPIVGFGSDNMYAWALCHLEVQFPNATEALDYIRDYYIK